MYKEKVMSYISCSSLYSSFGFVFMVSDFYLWYANTFINKKMLPIPNFSLLFVKMP